MFGSFTGRSINRRQSSDRRSRDAAHVPLMESNGEFMLFDRHYRPDRRLSPVILAD
jgi:hypothetical protein